MKKNVLFTFPYQQDVKGNSYPVIPLAIKSGKVKKEFFALIDSGATISIFRSEVAESLGVEIESGKEIYLGGVGGRIRGYIHSLELEIAGIKFICPAVFSREYMVSLNLLGRQEFFKRFRIIFEEKDSLLRLE